MACPFFRPTARMTEWPSPPRMPLGEPYWGVCVAGPEEFTPGEETVREQCNFGNARGQCARFPDDAAFDAVSLTCLGARDGSLELAYIVEKNYTPAGHGRLRFDVATGGFETAGAMPDSVPRQALAFAESYLRSKKTP